MASPQEMLALRQEAGKRVHDVMIERLIGFSPCGKLTVDDVLVIARMAQSLAFDATATVIGDAA